MNPSDANSARVLAQRLAEAEATIAALFSGEIDAIVDSTGNTPVLLSHAQRALYESEERYRQIVETTTDGIIKVDINNRVVFVNGRFAKMLGYKAVDMYGASLFDFMDASARAVVEQAIAARADGTVQTTNTVYRHKDGTGVAVNVAGSPLYDSDGTYVGSLGVVRDITEQKKLQAQLMVSDRMASVGTLAAGVAHEINNPLAALMANLEYIAESVELMELEASKPHAVGSDSRLLNELKASLEDAMEAAQRVRFIVRDLKIFSRSPIEEPGNAVNVEAIMESSLRMAWNEIRHRAQLVKHYGIIPDVKGNEARLGQVFLNLIINAAHAMDEGDAEHNELRITSTLEGSRVIIEVRDTGAGIPESEIARIFDAFYTTKPVGVGTGLGLAICQRIVTDMGGELTVTSEVGVGTAFRVSLLIASADETATPEARLNAAPVARRARILLVDDEELVLRSIKRTLSKDHDVIDVMSAGQALALCAGGAEFDLILCDLMMPDMTGMDLQREMLLVAPAQANRMVFVTGGAFTEQARQFLSSTVEEYLEKPFDQAKLRTVIQRYLR